MDTRPQILVVDCIHLYSISNSMIYTGMGKDILRKKHPGWEDLSVYVSTIIQLMHYPVTELYLNWLSFLFKKWYTICSVLPFLKEKWDYYASLIIHWPFWAQPHKFRARDRHFTGQFDGFHVWQCKAATMHLTVLFLHISHSFKTVYKKNLVLVHWT